MIVMNKEEFAADESDTKFMQLNRRRINPGELSEANLSVGQWFWGQLFDANIYRPFNLRRIRHPTL